MKEAMKKMQIEDQIENLLNDFENLKIQLSHKAAEIHQREILKDLDAKRTDWERRSALFVPLKEKLEKGAKTLELGEAYAAIKELRELREKHKIRQAALRDEMVTTRAELRNAEEALNIIENEYRDKLAAQTKLQNTVARVKTLDEQIQKRSEAAVQARNEYNEADRQYKECSEQLEKKRGELEKIEISLRETRKFLQFHSFDEKLQANLPGIQKCFSMLKEIEEKRQELKSLWSESIKKRQNAQNILNERYSELSAFNHKLAVHEKIFTKARSFFESSLKGKSLSEWREICEKNIKRLADLSKLYQKFQKVRDLEDKIKNFQDIKQQIQHETRELNIRNVEQSSLIIELQNEVEKLEKRSALLKRIQDIEAVRELLQDGIPCPLCGSVSHPYVSGASVPDPDEVYNQLAETQKNLEKLRTELSERQTNIGGLDEKLSSTMQNELELKKQLNEIKSEISSDVSSLGLNFSQGIPPLEEIDRSMQKTRDALKFAQNTSEAAEAAEAEMKTAGDELEKIREKREAAAHSHQEALFELQNEKTQEDRFSNETKIQDEAVLSLKRELISQIMPFGYKSVPDKNPDSVLEALESRMNEWSKNTKRCDVLEHEFSNINSKMAMLKKNSEALKAKCSDLSNRVKAVEAERNGLQQQRIVIFEAKNPDEETERMNETVANLRTQLNERRETKNERSLKLDNILSGLHGLETEMAKGREELQRNEINFGKKLLPLGFRSEDDYAASCLTSDERRELQNRLRELNQEDFELKSDHENAQAKLLEIQSEPSESEEFLTEKMKRLKNSLDEIIEKGYNNSNLELIKNEIVPEIKNLTLSCGLPEVF